MILLALGANLPSPAHGPPRQTLAAALAMLGERGVSVSRRSSWYETAPVPVSAQPWFVNAVAELRTSLPPGALLSLLHEIEAALGRQRGERWAARTIDLDLLAYDTHVQGWRDGEAAEAGLVLPHPRLHERAFVLRPLAELTPDWSHPVLGLSTREMLERLPPGQTVRPLEGSDRA